MSAAERAEFAISLKDETSGPARTAGKALQELGAKITGDLKKLRAMESAMRNLKGGTVTNVAAFRDLRDKIAAQKAAIAQAQARYVQLGGTFGDLAKSAGGAGGGMGSLLEIAERMPGPLGDMVGKLTSMRGLLAAGAIAAGILAVAAALVALVAALGAATAALLRYGVAQSDARRAELLQLEGLTTLRNYYGIAAGSATDLQAAIDRVSSSSALGRGRVHGMAQELYRAGLRGAALRESLESLAMIEQVQGEAGLRRMRGRVIADARAGRSAQRLADTQARLGSIARRQMLSLDVQRAKLHENIGRLFDGLQLDGFLSALHEVTELFSQNTASGRALKAIFEALFQPMLDALGTLGPLARRSFQGMVIGALLVTIGIQRLAGWLRRAFGGSDILAGINLQRAALLAGVAVVGMLVIGVMAAVAAFGALVASIAVLVGPFIAAAVAAAAIGAAIGTAIAVIQTTDWAGLGRSIINGLVNGIRSGIARVTSAVRDVASAARGAFTSAMRIASPSRVFADLGVQLPRGLERGIEAGTPGIERAVEGMVDVPSDATGGRGAHGGASSRSITIQELHVHGASGEPRDVAEAVREVLAQLLEGTAIEMGAPV